MPFTETQKSKFIALLLSKAWQMRDGTIWSPGGGLWFSNVHLETWSPADMHEVFTRRSSRIEKSKIGAWEIAAAENLEAARAAEEVMKHPE